MHRGPELAVEDDRGDPAGVDPGLISSSFPRPTNVRLSGWSRRGTIVSRIRWPADARSAEISPTSAVRETRRTSNGHPKGHDRHERFQWKPRGGAIRIPLRATAGLTLSKVNAMPEPCRSVVACA